MLAEAIATDVRVRVCPAASANAEITVPGVSDSDHLVAVLEVAAPGVGGPAITDRTDHSAIVGDGTVCCSKSTDSSGTNARLLVIWQRAS